jgi:nuclear pore complex protein Nup50
VVLVRKMAKRGAANYLTDQNWDHEEEPEEAGSFIPVGGDVMKSRAVKKAKRRITEGTSGGTTETGASNTFKGFTGFVAKSGTVPSFSFGADSSKPLSGLSNGTSAATINSTSGPPKSGLFTLAPHKQEGDGTSSTTSSSSDSKAFTNGSSTTSSSKKYLQQLKNLNESVTQWIKTHVEKNPYCILTPIFKDYEKYVAVIEQNNPDQVSSENQKIETPKTFSATGNSLVTSSGGFKLLESSVTTTNKPGDPPVFKLGGDSTVTSSSGAPFELSTSSSSSVPGGFSFKSPPSSIVGTAGQPLFAVGAGTSKPEEEEEYVPPKPEASTITEDDSKHSVRCKLFYQKDGNWTERGLGNLHLKPCDDKTQLLVRADTNLGNILLNIMLTSAMPAKRLGKNNVIIVCVPNPPVNPNADEDKKPVQMMIRVKTAEMADELLAKINECKG